jgi:hypothetical protein
MKKPEPRRTKAATPTPTRAVPVTELEQVRGGHSEGSIGSLQATGNKTGSDDWLASGQ